jgi:hypothetical protein
VCYFCQGETRFVAPEQGSGDEQRSKDHILPTSRRASAGRQNRGRSSRSLQGLDDRSVNSCTAAGIALAWPVLLMSDLHMALGITLSPKPAACHQSLLSLSP